MQHVCIDARLYNASGIGTFLKATLTSLAEACNYKLTLICQKKDLEELKSFPCRLIEMNTPIYTVREQLQYSTIIPRCDLFWSPHFNVPLAPIRAQKRLVTICDVFHLAHLSTLSLLQKVYAQVMYNAAIRLSDHVTTLSEFSKQEILSRTTFTLKQEIIVVNPITNRFSLQPRSQHVKNCILYVGNLKPHKNLVRLVEAYEHVRPEEPLVIVGSKEGLLTIDKELFKRVEKSLFLQHNVFFTGHVSDQKLKEWYEKAKMLVFPSLYEGFGYPPLEAMSYGCPVVAAKTASIPEICEDAVEYVDPLSVESIAAGMKRVLNDPFKQAELSQKGRELIERRQTKKNLMERVIDACCSRP